MSRALLILKNSRERQRAVHLCMEAPIGTRVEFKAAKRSIPQNDRMWAMLTEVSAQVKWYGVKLQASDWKIMFMNGLHHENRVVPAIDGNGYVVLQYKSSDLTKDEMSQLIELIAEFGARHSVKFEDQGEP